MVVPALPSEQTFWVTTGLTADVGEERLYADGVTEAEPGDVLSIVNLDNQKQTLVGAVLCSVSSESGPTDSDFSEGNFGGRPYAIAVNGTAMERPVDESQNPVVETDVPPEPTDGSARWAGIGAMVAAAGTAVWARQRRASRR